MTPATLEKHQPTKPTQPTNHPTNRPTQVALVSPDFRSPDYYTQIKKALTAGGYMQVGALVDVEGCGGRMWKGACLLTYTRALL